MALPILKAVSKPYFKTGIFSGIAEDSLLDVVNLVCNEQCHTRKSRKAVMLYSTPPDQIIPCNEHLFFRYGNTLKEVSKNENGKIVETKISYTLKNLDPAPDRKLILWDEKLYVFPDNIQVGTDVWLPFAKNYSVSVAFPFINSHTLFYPNGFSSSEFCEDADFLTVGMKMKFSWIPSKDFTIKTIETKNYVYEDSVIIEGIRVTLDDAVSNYNNIPKNATAKYTNPENRPILNDLMIGFNHQIGFLGQSIAIHNTGDNYSFSLKDYFKEGQRVKISGSSVESNNVTAKIISLSDGTIKFDKEFTAVTEAAKTVITLTPVIPDFSHFLITEDRLFGIDNSTGDFYISAVKNPFLFYDNPLLPEDAWTVSINGTATGLALWKDCVICFTEDGGFRILGYHALNFGVRQLSLNGIKKGCGDSLVRVGDTLYYYSEKGVMKYSGGSDKKISGYILNLLDVETAVTDGSFVYMLSNDRLWVYDTEMERWWSENAENITQIFKFDGQIYLTYSNALYLAESDLERKVDWSFELPAFKNPDFKNIIPLYLSLDYATDTNSNINVYFKANSESKWIKCGSYRLVNEGVIKIPIPKKHCKGFKIKVDGTGDFLPNSWCVCYKTV